MERLQLLLLLCCSSIPRLRSCLTVNASCSSSYWNTIYCALDITGDPVDSNTTYSLKFSGDENVTCPLLRTNRGYSCLCVLGEPEDIFGNADSYDISLCHESDCCSVKKKFSPAQNMQLTAPHQPDVQETPEAVNVTWKSGYELHRYLAGDINYMLQVQISDSPEAKPFELHSTNPSVLILKSQLKPHATYCVKVTSLPQSKEYKAVWSELSPAACWKNEGGKEEDGDNKLFILIKSLGPVCLAVGVMLSYVLNKPAIRRKIKTLSHTPTPAPFFQPLFQQHGGDLKEWLQPKGKFVMTYKTEEMLTADAVIVEPKPVTKDPEKLQVFSSPTTHLALAQCHTPYVGLPGAHEATAPPAALCPGGTPYTRLECALWGVAAGPAEVHSALPKDFLNTSSEDSGCSCADPTQSPERSLPDSPVGDCPPPLVCADYCILNKTAGGFVPVLLSQGGRLNVPSDALQEE